MMMIGGSVSVFSSIADYLSPNPYYVSEDEFVRNGGERMKPTIEGEKNELTNEEKSELREEYKRIVADKKETHKKQALNRMIRHLGWIIIPLPIFFYHRRIQKNEL